MVPNWRQLIVVTSNWGSYLVCPFSQLRCGILFCMSAYVCDVDHDRYIVVGFGSVTIFKMWSSTHAAPWSNYSHDGRDNISVVVLVQMLSL
jgi:hypothetical protein